LLVSVSIHEPARLAAAGGTHPDILMDMDCRAELARRCELRTVGPLPPLNVNRKVSKPFLEG
jgi:hypothetical protein